MLFFLAALMGIVSASGLVLIFSNVLADRKFFSSISGTKR